MAVAMAPHSSPRRQIGQALRRRRELAELTEHDLAALAGVSTATVSRLERGLTDARHTTWTALAEALGCDIGDIWPFEPGDDSLVRHARRRLGLSVADAAAKADISTRSVYRAEEGKRIHPARAGRLARVLRLPVDVVLPEGPR